MKAEWMTFKEKDYASEAELTKLEQNMKVDYDSMKAEWMTFKEKDNVSKAELVSYKENAKLDFDSMKDTLASVNNKTINIENAIKDYAGKEVLCGIRHHVIS